MRTLVHNIKIGYFIKFGDEEIVLSPLTENTNEIKMLKIHVHGFFIGNIYQTMNSNLIFYN